MRKHGKIIIELHSDACIHSGYSYRGTIDNDVCCDRFGIPFIPARRLKGCLREAASLIKKHPDLQGESADFYFGERGSGVFVPDMKQKNDVAGNASVRGYGSVIIENARVPNYEQIWEALENFENTPMKKYIGRQEILAQYTSVRAQTRMVSTCDKAFADDPDVETLVPSDIGIGCALDNTLRFTRVVNAHRTVSASKSSDGEQAQEGLDKPAVERSRFEADIYYYDFDKESDDEQAEGLTPIEKALTAIVKSVRHIGLSRNRGLGSVSCRFEPDVKAGAAEAQTPCSIRNETKVDIEHAIFFSVKNTEPLVISEGNDNRTESYIPARNVSGALAWEYLSQDGNSAESEEFRHLFLDGTIRYTNLYIMDGEERCIPAPGFVNELKKTKLLVNSLRLDEYDPDKKEEDPGDGNLPKKLRGKYICVGSNGTIRKKEVETEIIYHNRHTGADDETGIYSQEVISEGQVFGGYIFCDADALKKLPEDISVKLLQKVRELLENTNLRFGKSRSAQYGRCVLMPGMPKYSCMQKPYMQTVKPEGMNSDSYKKRHVLVCLTSDGIFSENGCYTTAFNSVYKTVASDAGISDYVDIDAPGIIPDQSHDARLTSICDTGITYGFNSKWNLRRQPIPTVLAGSTFVYELKKGLKEFPDTTQFVQAGEHRTDGFGELRMFLMSETELPYRLDNYAVSKQQLPSAKEGHESSDWEQLLDSMLKDHTSAGTAAAAELIKQCILNKTLEEMRRKVIGDLCDDGAIKISSSTIGRVSLMLDEVRRQESSPEKQFLEFAGRGDKDHPSRIRSIKREKEKKKLEKVIKKYFVKPEAASPDADWNLDSLYMLDQMLPKSKNEELRHILNTLFDSEEQKRLIKSFWPEIMEMFLRGSKYIKKVSGGSGE